MPLESPKRLSPIIIIIIANAHPALKLCMMLSFKDFSYILFSPDSNLYSISYCYLILHMRKLSPREFK